MHGRILITHSSNFQFLLFTFLVLLLPVSTFGKDLFNGDLRLEIGRMHGNTSSQIGGEYQTESGEEGNLRFPYSKIELPLNLYIGSITASFTFFEGVVINMNYTQALNDDAGKVKGYEWGYYHANGLSNADADSLDIYYEGNAQAKSVILADISVGYSMLAEKHFLINAEVGIKSQEFIFEGTNRVQEYPSSSSYFGEEFADEKSKGKFLEYDVKYTMPYISVGGRYLEANIRFIFNLTYSPVTKAIDNTKFILEDKTSRGECEGYMAHGTLSFDYFFNQIWFASFTSSYLGIVTKGNQKQSISGVDTVTIEQKITSEQASALLSIGAGF